MTRSPTFGRYCEESEYNDTGRLNCGEDVACGEEELDGDNGVSVEGDADKVGEEEDMREARISSASSCALERWKSSMTA